MQRLKQNVTRQSKMAWTCSVGPGLLIVMDGLIADIEKRASLRAFFLLSIETLFCPWVSHTRIRWENGYFSPSFMRRSISSEKRWYFPLRK